MGPNLVFDSMNNCNQSTIVKIWSSDYKAECFQHLLERFAWETQCFSANFHNVWGIWNFSAKLSSLRLAGLSPVSFLQKVVKFQFQQISINLLNEPRRSRNYFKKTSSKCTWRRGQDSISHHCFTGMINIKWILNESWIICKSCQLAFLGKSLEFIWEVLLGSTLDGQPAWSKNMKASSASPTITLFIVLLLALKGRSLESIWEVSLGSAILDLILWHSSQPWMVQRRGQRTTSAKASSSLPTIILFTVLLLALKGK